jgi:hypothetical protein
MLRQPAFNQKGQHLTVAHLKMNVRFRADRRLPLLAQSRTLALIDSSGVVETLLSPACSFGQIFWFSLASRPT